MMHGHEKSDLAIVAEKPANKAEQPTAEASTGASAAEPVERRAGTKGNAGQQSTCRAQNRISVSQALERIRQFAVATAPQSSKPKAGTKPSAAEPKSVYPKTWEDIDVNSLVLAKDDGPWRAWWEQTWKRAHTHPARLLRGGYEEHSW